MYDILKSKTFFRSNPWEKPYEARIKVLQDAKKAGRRTVGFLYPKFDSSTFRYRGYNICESLEYSIQWSGAYFQNSDLGQLIKNVDIFDVMVFIRCPWEPEIEEFINELHIHGKKICYDIDDLIYHPKYMPMVIDTLGLDRELEWKFWFDQSSRNMLVAEKCDAYITTNEYLAGYLKKDFEGKCYVIKNYLNWIQEAVSNEYFEKKMKMSTTGNFVIGYFSGSPTHLNDLLMIMPEIEEFMERHEDVRMKIVGYMKLPSQYDYLVKEKKITYVPFQTFVELQYEQAEVDLNIVPLVNTVFSNCKSELKYFETAIVGTPTCATPSFTYRSAIDSGENGFLCERGEWIDRFEEIYNNRDDKEFKKKIREAALDAYSSIKMVKAIEDTFDNIFIM